MASKLIHGEGDLFGKRYSLLPWHVEFLWRWFEEDPVPGPSPWWYDEALVGRERGAVKTEFFAGMAALEMGGPAKFRRRTPIVELAAASWEQTGELFRQAQFMCGGPKGHEVPSAPLFGLFDVFEDQIAYRDGRPGMIRRRAAVAGTSEGGKPTLFLGDEMHEWTGRKERVYTVHTAGLSKGLRGGRACVMSTAAAGRGSIPAKDTDPLLWRLYSRGLLQKGDPASRFLFDWCESDPALDMHDPEQLRRALRQMSCADITWRVERRARDIESRKIPLHEAQRYYLNQFIDLAHDSWLSEAPPVWGECFDEGAVPADGSPVVVGVDMALRGDSVGVVAAGFLPDGRVGWHPRNWVPDGSGKIDHLDVFGYIAGVAASRWRVKAVVYDPRFFELPARMLEDQGLRVIEFPQSPERLIPADGHLWQLLLDHQIAHPGDAVLTAHAQAASWRITERGRYLSKGRSGLMDLVRAGSMATWELCQPELDYGPAQSAGAVAVGAENEIFRPSGRLDL